MQVRRTKRKAVAPVLATLMMIAVAVAMSVIIFVWSQGFLSQTSSAAGGQQSQQNLAASSGISIEAAVFTPGNSGTGTGQVIVVIRNVGSVSEVIGSFQIDGVPSNAGFKGADICPFSSGTATCTTPGGTSSHPNTATLSSTTSIGKGSSVTLTYTIVSTNVAGNEQALNSGDSLNLKITTSVGTFATQQYTVP